MKTRALQDREIAKQIVVEIIRQAGGVLKFKTSLFKAFYHAHLHFADNHPGYLSAWPIVRMPRGPGIDRFDMLLGELMAEGRVATKEIKAGDFNAFQFALCGDGVRVTPLSEGALESIAYGVRQVVGKTAMQVSEESHQMSRAWREANDGDELNIYLDSLNSEAYKDCMGRASQIGNEIDSAFGR